MKPQDTDPIYLLKNLPQVQPALPLGGMGAGSISLNAYGGLQDFAIRHHPTLTALPDGHRTMDAAFALVHIKGREPITRLVEGPLPPEKIYDQGLQGNGYRHGGYEGLPRFRKATFDAGFPFGRTRLSDARIPLTAEIVGFSPFIPGDDKNSGLPCALLEYTFTNRSAEAVKFEFSYHLSHLAIGSKERERGALSRAVPNRGILFDNTDDPLSAQFGTSCLLALQGRPRIKGMWFRGGWFDAVSCLWHEVSSGKFTTNSGSNGVDFEGRAGGSLLFPAELAPGESTTFRLAIAWHFPNVHYTHGVVAQCCEDPSSDAACSPQPSWRPYYAGVWKDAQEVAEYVRRHYKSLRERSIRFNRTLLSSSLPSEVLDAISSNLAILKSPTVLRQENGNIWAWEGCFAEAGCCPGSCTHVWNYAQAMPHLFPQLERTLREQELLRSQNENGHINFRAALPDGPAGHGYHAAADGQLGGILKLFRDWQISGDTPWMQSLYPHARKSLEYCIQTWDPDRLGALIEPHHNTYDIEFWGPDAMCTSIYVGALSAMGLLATAVGAEADAITYTELAERGAKYMRNELFNGDYHIQRIRYKDLRDRSFIELLEDPQTARSEVVALLRKEGPKYQYGNGCLSDGIIGAWMARIYGVTTPIDVGQIRNTLKSIYKYNFRKDLSTHANCQRPGYGIGKEAGLLLCSWPHGDKPALPFVYSDEVWTGIEYQVASHLIEEGFIKEGLAIVKAVRRRYDGRARNPFNEYECGNFYARAMASYALLGSLSGFHYSAVDQCLRFGPRLESQPFQCFFATAEGWGTIRLEATRLIITLEEGRLRLRKIRLQPGSRLHELDISTTVSTRQPATFQF